jgi:hypothetical protein
MQRMLIALGIIEKNVIKVEPGIAVADDGTTFEVPIQMALSSREAMHDLVDNFFDQIESEED